MDTRTKILPGARGLRVNKLVIGTFDPVVAEHAARLAALGPGLTVAIVEPEGEPLLPARARAELVAALRVVDHVVLGDPRGELATAEIIDETAAHRAARQRVIDRIVSA